jgi:1-acyl-sn-glycerol-3-phosphate acyltransferase
MIADACFGILRGYSTAWMRSRCRLVIDGEENLRPAPTGPRTYIVLNHSTTFDLVALMHISASRFSVVMDEGAFNVPVIRHLFSGAGFIPLVKEDSARAVNVAVEKIRAGVPVLMSLTDGAATIGGEERPRTGGVRIAHMAGAVMYPVFVMVEEDRKLHRSLKGLDGRTHPFTTFRDTVYIVDFLPPIRPEVFRRDETYEGYAALALRMKVMADAEKQRYSRVLADPAGRFAGMPRTGGTSRRVTW